MITLITIIILVFIYKIIPYKEKVLGIIIIDDNDSKKNALYKINIDSNKYILSLIKWLLTAYQTNSILEI